MKSKVLVTLATIVAAVTLAAEEEVPEVYRIAADYGWSLPADCEGMTALVNNQQTREAIVLQGPEELIADLEWLIEVRVIANGIYFEAVANRSVFETIATMELDSAARLEALDTMAELAVLRDEAFCMNQAATEVLESVKNAIRVRLDRAEATFPGRVQ